MRHKYDSSVIFLYNTGNEYLLPKSFRQKIPYTTIASWRKSDYRKYKGYEFRNLIGADLDKAELLHENRRLRSAMVGFTRSWILLSSATIPLLIAAEKDREIKARVVQAVDALKVHVGLEKALKLIGLSRTLYYQWTMELRFDCYDSFTALCAKRHPQQLQVKEIKKIKDLLLDPEYAHWPIISVAALALRNNKLVASPYAWYKYGRAFKGIRKPYKKKRKTKGLMATLPNEYLHVDTTFYPLLNEKFACISFVMDNYSKMILGFHVAGRNNFELVRRSMSNALETIAKHPDAMKPGSHSFMVTDGGSENHNHMIDEFIAKLTEHKLTKIKALKDIRFSNSPVEAIHKTIKSRYLKGRQFESIEVLSKFLEWAVMDYNTLRPHYKHRPRTPHEVYFKIPLDFDAKKRAKKAMQKRVKANKNSKCIQCSGARSCQNPANCSEKIS